MHREYSSPQTGWSELRSAAFGMDGVTLACNPMGARRRRGDKESARVKARSDIFKLEETK
jgi:hypothetical protein